METDLIFSSLIVALGLLPCASSARLEPVVSALPALHVADKHLADSVGKRVRLRGVNVASLEWSTNGEGHVLDTLRVATHDWHSNIVRLPLSQDRWMGKATDQHGDAAPYRKLVAAAVEACENNSSYAILDLHWSDAGVWGKQIGQHKMPDTNSIAFWKEVAAAYKNRSSVIFDLYNEPHNVTWDVWKKGGEIDEKDEKTGEVTRYTGVGMQALLDTVRATGAKNVVIAGGLDWAYDMSGFLQGNTLQDASGNGVVYANHTYPFKGDAFVTWQRKIRFAASQIPVIVSEFGPVPKKNDPNRDEWIRQVLQELKDTDLDWTAWDMHPGASPCLISGWDYKPTDFFGTYVKQALEGKLAPYTVPDTAGDRKP